MRRIITITLLLALSQALAFAQPMTITLEEAMTMAKQQSYESFAAQYAFVLDALNFQSAQKRFLPTTDLSVTPANYNRSISELWDSNDQQYYPYQVQNLSTNARVSLNQNVKATGGTFSASSSLHRSQTFKEVGDDFTTYISNPISLTYSQNFSRINSFKWQVQLDSLMYNEARMQYLEDVETMKLKAIDLYFSLLMAEVGCEIAEQNKANADTLYYFGEQKLAIGAITRDDYLNLQLRKVNAEIELDTRMQDYKQAQLALNNFLELPMTTEVKCEVPSELPQFAIDANTALGKAYANNPDLIALEANLVQARRDVKAAKRNRYSADFRATIGLNQNQDKLGNAYKELQDQETVSFTVAIPLLDWGEGRRSINRAQVNQMMQEESARKRKDAIAIEIMNMVSDFNIRYKQVMASSKANEIAQEAYEAVQKQFMLGKSSVLEVNSSYTSMQSAQNNYISSLNRFWVQLYSLRKICLYDFEEKQDITADFDELIEVEYK